MGAGGSFSNLGVMEDVGEAWISVTALFLAPPYSLFLSHRIWGSCVPGSVLWKKTEHLN